MLEQVGIYNDLSPKLRKQLEERVLSFGKRVRYKFKISNPNPDPQKTDGAVIWPFRYTLDPVTFSITDSLEDRANKQKVKRIGIIAEMDAEGKPQRFKRVRVEGRYRGVVEFDLENPDDFEMAAYLELHPKQVNGLFADKNKLQVFERIDEKKLATEKRTERSLRLLALNVAQGMSDSEIVDFADANGWDSTEDIDILRSRVEEMAEETPGMFKDFIESSKIEYQSAVQRALDKKVIAFDPTEHKFYWVENNQVITVVSASTESTEIEKMSLWLQTGGTVADKVYKKIKSLSK